MPEKGKNKQTRTGAQNVPYVAHSSAAEITPPPPSFNPPPRLVFQEEEEYHEPPPAEARRTDADAESLAACWWAAGSKRLFFLPSSSSSSLKFHSHQFLLCGPPPQVTSSTHSSSPSLDPSASRHFSTFMKYGCPFFRSFFIVPRNQRRGLAAFFFHFLLPFLLALCAPYVPTPPPSSLLFLVS
jgi:hypothetical protein